MLQTKDPIYMEKNKGDMIGLADKDGNYPACDGLGFSCDPSNSHVFVRNQTTGLLDQSNSVIVTNQTACSDGYIHAWNHVCDQDKARKFSLDCPLRMPRGVSTPILAHGLTEADRYNSGYRHGVAYAGQHNINATGNDCSLEVHTVSYCHGYSAGFEARENDLG